MTSVEEYLKDSDRLKLIWAQTQVKIQNCTEEAKKLKKELADRGYKDLAAAKEDYIRRSGELTVKHQKVKDLLHQIEVLETSIPSKETILEELRNSVKIVEQAAVEVQQGGSSEEQEATAENVSEPVVSQVSNSQDKVSGVVGQDVTSSENISVLSEQSPQVASESPKEVSLTADVEDMFEGLGL